MEGPGEGDERAPSVRHAGSAGQARRIGTWGRIVPVGYVLRPARAGDAPFLTEMLVAAAFWRADGPVGTVQEVLSNPNLAHYVEGWPRPGDLGVVAEDERPIGAAWLRYFPEDDPGFGFVNAAIPEVGMAVVKESRGRGVGGRLLAALVDLARDQQVEALSLSVEADNYARRLYERIGFRRVNTVGGSFTMLLRL